MRYTDITEGEEQVLPTVDYAAATKGWGKPSAVTRLTPEITLYKWSKYLTDYDVVIDNKKVADFHFYRQKTPHDVIITSRLDISKTGERIERIASYFGDALKYIKNFDWSDVL